MQVYSNIGNEGTTFTSVKTDNDFVSTLGTPWTMCTLLWVRYLWRSTPSFRFRDNSVHFHKCSPFWVGISTTQSEKYFFRLCFPLILRTVISYTPCWDTAILPRGGISLSSTTPQTLLRLGQCYPTLPNHFFMTTTTKVQPNKLPQTTIKFRIIDGTIRFNNTKIQTHALGSICVRRDSI